MRQFRIFSVASVFAMSAFFLLSPGAFAEAPAAPAKPAAKGPTADEIGKKVQQFYDSLKTFKATFSQTYTIKIQNVKKESKGKVTIEKPAKMNWVYDAPNGNRVVSDGSTIRVYEKENEQMYETPVKTSQYPAELAFLMGKGQLI
jgi:outer membrane lipoprotein carrier protein